MELKILTCPNCGAILDVEDGLDTFFCKYCGHKILLENQSKAAYEAKVSIKNMEHKERLQDKRNAQERYKLEQEQKAKQKKTIMTLLIVLGSIAVLFALCFGMIAGEDAKEKRMEQELQAIVEEILIDIENESFVEAYIKANSLHWERQYIGDDRVEKWNEIRKSVIEQIKKAEKEAS